MDLAASRPCYQQQRGLGCQQTRGGSRSFHPLAGWPGTAGHTSAHTDTTHTRTRSQIHTYGARNSSKPLRRMARNSRTHKCANRHTTHTCTRPQTHTYGARTSSKPLSRMARNSWSIMKDPITTQKMKKMAAHGVVRCAQSAWLPAFRLWIGAQEDLMNHRTGSAIEA